MRSLIALKNKLEVYNYNINYQITLYRKREWRKLLNISNINNNISLSLGLEI